MTLESSICQKIVKSKNVKIWSFVMNLISNVHDCRNRKTTIPVTSVNIFDTTRRHRRRRRRHRQQRRRRRRHRRWRRRWRRQRRRRKTDTWNLRLNFQDIRLKVHDKKDHDFCWVLNSVLFRAGVVFCLLKHLPFTIITPMAHFCYSWSSDTMQPCDSEIIIIDSLWST